MPDPTCVCRALTQMTWERYVVDAVFRGGKKHSNHGQTVTQMIRHIVHKIRKHYRREAPIVVHMDSGLFDQKLLEVFQELRIGYECTGRLYEDLKAYVQQADGRWWGRYHNGEQAWDYLEFGDRRGTWSRRKTSVRRWRR